MSTPFFSGLLSLAEADAEAALIPSAITFLQAIQSSKTALERAAAVGQLEANVIEAGAAIGPELLGQVAPQLVTQLQALLTKAQSEVQAAATPAKA